LPGDRELTESVAALRRGQAVPPGHKVLIVLDQFEQWLHARRVGSISDRCPELVQAVRQCDGERVQCLVMVRDDFWLAVSRFMKAIEVEIVEGQNSGLVDLFDPLHARKVLSAFGRAYGRLPDDLAQCSKDQDGFLEQAVTGLAQDGKIISVRLALFAEMVKGKPWTPVTLQQVGGTEGVGVAFLEETFAASTAPPQHRLHQKAAQAVLKALLPEAGTDIKGNLRSQQELLEVSGYADRPKDFSQLLHILDGELRLLTPIDPESQNDALSQVQDDAKYYQLTHDYLVPSLRDWLTRKQKETRRGRAELLLADRVGAWNLRSENRQLPSLLQWLQIRCLTSKTTWTPPQRKMMEKARRYYGLRGTIVALLLAVATVSGLFVWEQVDERRKVAHAAGLVHSLLNADTSQVPAIVAQMAEYRKWTEPLLREAFRPDTGYNRQSLNVSLALLPNDFNQVEYLYDCVYFSKPFPELHVLRDALRPHKDKLIERLWYDVLVGRAPQCIPVLPYASLLADYAPDDPRWAKLAEKVVGPLLEEAQINQIDSVLRLSYFQPVRLHLVPPLIKLYRQKDHAGFEVLSVTRVVTAFARDQPQVLADVLMDAEERQFGVIYACFKEEGERGLSVLTGEIDKNLPPELPSSDERRERLAKRQANAAVALLRMNRPEKVWPLLRHSPDPRARSYLIHRLCPLGADAAAIIQRLDEEPDLTIRRALLLSLGEFDEKALSPQTRQALFPRLQEIYRTATDAGLHAAAEWLLRQWKQQDWLTQVNDDWARGKMAGGAWRVAGKGRLMPPPSTHHLPPATHHPSPGWYVNGQGQTMVVIPGPAESVMGSPPGEDNHEPNESRHTKRIGRTFAISAKAVTKEEFLRFRPSFSHEEFQRYPEPTCPIGGVLWYEAAAYCNWLSEQEGIPKEEWCYEPKTSEPAALVASTTGLLGCPSGPGMLLSASAFIPGRSASGEYAEGMKLKVGYLKRTGYRLPTEAEMEYATRAGALTSRYYGETVNLLDSYCWYLENSKERTWPVGSKKPNDWGLFDTHGNVFTWCQERFRAYPDGEQGKVFEDTEDLLTVGNLDERAVRGGSFRNPASVVRSALRAGSLPADRTATRGLRPVRTFTP
jgi:formylglycine-generating enzyme required for sulfatase activity